jgi:hypothetical protein
VDVRALLNIVGQMKMGIVEFIIVGLRARRANADKKEHGDQRNKQPGPSALYEYAFHVKEYPE